MIPLSDPRGGSRFPVFTVFIIAANVWIFFLFLDSPDRELFVTQYALIPRFVSLLHPETLIPFITSMFIHGGIFHIVSNMWFLWIFGDNVEERLGLFFLPFYLTGGVAASFIQYLSDPRSPIPMVGASGAVAAVLGAYLVFFPGNKIKTLVPVLGLPLIVDIPAVIMLFYWFILQVVNGVVVLSLNLAGGGIAWFAHAGGFTTGWVLAMLWPKNTHQHKQSLWQGT